MQKSEHRGDLVSRCVTGCGLSLSMCVHVSVCVRVCVLWNTSKDSEAGEGIRLLAEGEPSVLGAFMNLGALPGDLACSQPWSRRTPPQGCHTLGGLWEWSPSIPEGAPGRGERGAGSS